MEGLKFEGGWTALVTPFGSRGEVDWDGLRKNVEFQLSQGISGLVPTGTTGESPTLDWHEHNRAITLTVKAARDRIPVLAGTGSNSTSEAIEATAHARAAGARAVLLVDCYYNGPSSLELRTEYYGRVARRFRDMAIVPYIIPGRTGTALSPEDVAILAAEFRNVPAVKEATGDIERMVLTRRLAPGIAILSGDDDITYRVMTNPDIRASGVVSVISNAAPGAVERMTREILAKSPDAGRTAEALAPLLSIVTVKVKNERRLPDGRTVEVEDKFRNPLAIKTLMAGLGMPAGRCRPPLGKMTPPGVAVVREAARKVWERNPEILSPIEDFYGVKMEKRLATDRYWK